MVRRLLLFVSIALSGVVASSPSIAADGVIEINQVAAIAGGITPSDAPGFPITLGSSGSYRLTGNLTPPVNTNAIDITANRVTLDLGGFSISRPRVVICGPSGCPQDLANGIVVSNAASGAVIRNGTIENIERLGVIAGEHARVENLTVRDNRHIGISTGRGSIIRGCVVADNDSYGILAGPGTLVTHNNVSGNGERGMLCQTVSSYDCAYGSNVFYDNNGSTNPAAQVLNGVQTEGNLCQSVSCP